MKTLKDERYIVLSKRQYIMLAIDHIAIGLCIGVLVGTLLWKIFV